MIAVRPVDDGDSRNYDQFTWICKTCHCSVTERCIGGIWTHSTNRFVTKGEDCDHNCTELIPMKSQEHDRDAKWKCQHEIRFVDGMTRAVKCTKCETVYYPYDLEFSNNKGDYFCITCQKSFKRMKKHVETVHANKLFEVDCRGSIE